MARLGCAWQVQVGRGPAWQGVARLQGEIPALFSKVGIMKYYTEARQGRARHGNARCGMARQGQQGEIPALYSIFTNLSQIILDEVWSGTARSGEAWCGKARLQGEIPALYSIFTYYTPGRARRGMAGFGEVGHGKGTGLQNPVHYA